MIKTVKNRYIILGVGMLMQLCAGIIYMWSVFREPVANHLSWDKSSASLTSSVMLAAFVLGIIIGGLLQDKYTPSPVALGGSFILGAGMVAASFVPESAPWLIYVFYGILGGFGVGCIYTATVSVVQKWFPDKRGFATGMMVGSFGFSLVLFAPVTKDLLKARGVPNTFIFFGILFFVICSLCSLFIRNPDNPAGTASAASLQKQYKTTEMLRTGRFYLLALSMFFLLPAYFILNPLLMSLGIERGLTEDTAAVGVMITGVASASGRLITSWFSDFVGRKAAIFTISVLTLAAALFTIFASGAFFLVCIAAIAFCFGGSASVYAATSADLFGTKHAGFNYGCVMVGFGLSALIFPFVSNQLAKTGELTLSFIISAASCIITIVLVSFLRVPKKEG